ncbi:hypothetical protein H6G89_18695 [Oscillatoria sp. FACHB-1407]|uniref:hypothetical protein n=1 Tax=Oscillatoria sp. FACHB-1407 TaxID=2692847 RepID=UPI0016890455|nr:hypothetical protein [Oscillatoria sp. FACHB-1407]MBD2463068.1 hypothetical protein [Oscillatoria sp. FACHB-1407]
MALLAHFQPLLNADRLWHWFSHAWAAYTAADLNHSLLGNDQAAPYERSGIGIGIGSGIDLEVGGS